MQLEVGLFILPAAELSVTCTLKSRARARVPHDEHHVLMNILKSLVEAPIYEDGQLLQLLNRSFDGPRNKRISSV